MPHTSPAVSLLLLTVPALHGAPLSHPRCLIWPLQWQTEAMGASSGALHKTRDRPYQKSRPHCPVPESLLCVRHVHGSSPHCRGVREYYHPFTGEETESQGDSVTRLTSLNAAAATPQTSTKQRCSLFFVLPIKYLITDTYAF